MDRKIIIGIDASSSVDGGSQTHLIEILRNITNDILNNINTIIVFSNKKTLNLISDRDYIIKYSNYFLESNIVLKKIWVNFFLKKKLIKYNCDILLDISGTYIGSFVPYVGMSRNMLIFEKKEVKRFNSLLQIIRYFFLKKMQIYSFNNSAGVVFISNYAKNSILKYLKHNINWVVINHGISEIFLKGDKKIRNSNLYTHQNKFKLLYVSNLLPFKHQYNVVKAVNELSQANIPIELFLYGGHSNSKYGKRVINLIENESIGNVKYFGKVSYENMPEIYKSSDAFIFASSCENMPNILIEAMASGLPIVCSIYGPMPEFGLDAVVYFDPTNIGSIKEAILSVFSDLNLQQEMILKNNKLIEKYSWLTSSSELFKFLYFTCTKK